MSLAAPRRRLLQARRARMPSQLVPGGRRILIILSPALPRSLIEEEEARVAEEERIAEEAKQKKKEKEKVHFVFSFTPRLWRPVPAEQSGIED